MAEIAALVTSLNGLTPLGLAAGLAYVIYLLIKSKGQVSTITDNHLHGLPDMANDLKEIKTLLQSMNDNIIYLKARSNGK